MVDLLPLITDSLKQLSSKNLSLEQKVSSYKNRISTLEKENKELQMKASLHLDKIS